MFLTKPGCQPLTRPVIAHCEHQKHRHLQRAGSIAPFRKEVPGKLPRFANAPPGLRWDNPAA